MSSNAPAAIDRDPALLVDGPLAGKKIGFQYRFVTPAGGRITGMRAWCDKGPITALQVLGVDSTGAPANSRVWGSSIVPLPPYTTEIVLDPSDFLIGITGTISATLDNVVLHTMNEASGDPEKRLGSSGGQTAYSIMPDQLPLGAEIVGFYWWFNAAGVTCLGPVCQVPGPPNPGLLDPDVRWLDSTAPPYPSHDISDLPEGIGFGTPLPPMATFVAPKLFRVELDGRELNIYDETAKANVLTFQHILADAPSGDHQYLYRDELGTEVTVKLPGATHGDIEWQNGRRLRSAQFYETVDDKEPTFGHVFAEGTESAFDTSPYQGWDVTAIDPMHLQYTDHVRQKIFAYPADSSHLYHKSEYGKQRIVPNGVMYVTQAQSDGNSRTMSASSELEIQTAWKSSIGGKAGFGPFTFKASASFRGSVKSTLTAASSSTVSTFTLRSHMLFVDLPRVNLGPDFVDDVNQLITGSAVEYQNFITTYGTHFAYAITYGARSYMQIGFSKEATVQALSAGTSMEAKAGGVFDGLNLGVSASSSIDVSTQIGHEISSQLKEYHTEGGEASNDGHLSLGTTPVPMLLDLRPLSDLLNPVFFTDERIYQGVRFKLNQAMQEYCKNAGPDFDSRSHLPPILRLYFVSVRWKSTLRPDPSRVVIALEFYEDSRADIAGKFFGFDSYDRFEYLSTVWKATDPGAPRLRADGSEVSLGIEKLIFILEPIPEVVGFLFSYYFFSGPQTPTTLLVKNFRRDVQTVVADIGDFAFTLQYQLLGADITWEQANTPGLD